jgi:hypothetical protein
MTIVWGEIMPVHLNRVPGLFSQGSPLSLMIGDRAGGLCQQLTVHGDQPKQQRLRATNAPRK